uniref:Uncharacterized protein n=1 Tax=Eutreptiella gymnastica TaxID=73025 RepID=A0A7S4D3W6_9EUGL
MDAGIHQKAPHGCIHHVMPVCFDPCWKSLPMVLHQHHANRPDSRNLCLSLHPTPHAQHSTIPAHLLYVQELLLILAQHKARHHAAVMTFLLSVLSQLLLAVCCTSAFACREATLGCSRVAICAEGKASAVNIVVCDALSLGRMSHRIPQFGT